MNPADARWILAQPEALRRALVEVPGPGWELWRGTTVDGTPMLRVECLRGWVDADERFVRGWLPCDPCAIVAEAARISGYALFAVGVDAGGPFALLSPRPGAPPGSQRLVHGPTPFRAAVALLAAALGVEPVEVSDAG